jgi:hypothetical protein
MTHIYHLPTDVFYHMLEFLEIQDTITTIALVSKSWYALTTNPHRFSHIHLRPTTNLNPQIISSHTTQGGNGISDELLNVIAARYPLLESLTINRENRAIQNYHHKYTYTLPEKSDEYFTKYHRFLENHHDMKELAVESQEFTYKGLFAIALRCTCLVRLCLYNCFLTTQDLEAIRSLNKHTLRELVLDSCRFDEMESNLNVHASDIIRDNQMAIETSFYTPNFDFPNLEVFIFKAKLQINSLILPECKYLEISTRITQNINIPKVEYLTLYNEEYIPLHTLPNLIGLRLIDVNMITAEKLDQILLNPNLRHLEIIGLEGLIFVQTMFSYSLQEKTYCNKLAKLKLRCSSLDDRCMERIATLFPKLESFTLQGNSTVSDSGFAKLLAKCLTLVELDMSSCNVTETVLGYVAKSSVTDLSISARKMSNFGLQKLIISKVRKLVLKGINAAISTSTIEALRQSGIQVKASMFTQKRKIPVTSATQLYSALYDKNEKISCLYCRKLVLPHEYDAHELIHEEVPITRTQGVCAQCYLPTCMHMEWGSIPNETKTKATRIVEHLNTNCNVNEVKCPSCLKFMNRKDIEAHMGSDECEKYVYNAVVLSLGFFTRRPYGEWLNEKKLR